MFHPQEYVPIIPFPAVMSQFKKLVLNDAFLCTLFGFVLFCLSESRRYLFVDLKRGFNRINKTRTGSISNTAMNGF